MEATNMFLFSNQHMTKLFSRLSIERKEIEIMGGAGTTGETKKIGIFINEEQQECSACGVPIFLENLGHIVCGSKDFYCSNPACFAHYIANNKIEK